MNVEVESLLIAPFPLMFSYSLLVALMCNFWKYEALFSKYW